MTESRHITPSITTIEERLDALLLEQAHYTTDCLDRKYTDAQTRMDARDAQTAAIVNDWRYALDALNIEIRTRTIRHRNGTLYCMNCKEYHKDGHAPGCSVGICIKARDKLSGRTE